MSAVKKLSLTPEGECFTSTAKKFSNLMALEEQMQEIEDVVSGNIVSPTIYSIGLHMLSAYIKKFS